MRKPLVLLAALVGASLATAAPAQSDDGDGGNGAAAAAAALTPEQAANLRLAASILRAFTLAFQSEDVQQPVKGVLLTCLYNNPLSALSVASGQVFANNPGLQANNLADVYRVAAGVCGVEFRRVNGGENGANGDNGDDTPTPAPEQGR